MKGDFTNFDEASRRHWESMSDPVVGPGQGIEAVKHLQRLFRKQPFYRSGDMDEKYCLYCHGEEGPLTHDHYEGPWTFTHDPDCPWVAAKAFLDQLSTPTAADAPPR